MVNRNEKHNMMMIGNDHGGYELKVKLISHLQSKGLMIEDIGSHSTDIVRYPYYASVVAKAISRGKISRGVLICSTGIGMSIIANKYKGVRAAVCHSSYEAKMTSAHNNSNILCLGGQCLGTLEAIDIVEQWLNTPYDGGRHDISLGLISQAEEIHFSGELWRPDIPKIQ